MVKNDIDGRAVGDTILRMPARFHTKDLSRHPDMVKAHLAWQRDRNYHAIVGKYLKEKQRELGIRFLEGRAHHDRGALWEQTDSRAEPRATPTVAATEPVARPAHSEPRASSDQRVVRSGHYRTLAYMASQEFRGVKELFEGVPEFGGVYFRPTDKGVTVVDLHPESLKPRVGVGDNPYVVCGTMAADLLPSISERVAYLERVRARQTCPSRENQFEAFLIRYAQSNHLCLPGFPDRLRFIHSQWRMDPDTFGRQRFTDLLAVDLCSRGLVVIELKADSDSSAFSQVSGYLDYFRLHADELEPFFTRVAQVMGTLYDCPELCALGNVAGELAALVAWPSGSGRTQVHGLEGLPHEGGTATELTPTTGSQLDDGDELDMGPQSSGDQPFTARMRLHQSWYRARVLKVPCGTGPGPASTTLYGNMLRPDDGDRGLNFLSPGIFNIVKSRLDDQRGAVEPFRLLNNMLSSQPMCFNLLGCLAGDLSLATAAFSALLGDGEVARVTQLLFEYAPEPQGEYLNDRTAFDAFVTYERPGGGLGFLGIETKLTEPFSQKHYDSPAYRRWVERPDSPWPSEAWGRMADIEHNQLWRDHLLAVAARRHPRSPYTAGRFALVRHSQDGDCARVAARYRVLLKDPDESFLDLPLDRLVDIWQRALPAGCSEWLAGLRLRYLDLGASDEEWRRMGRVNA